MGVKLRQMNNAKTDWMYKVYAVEVFKVQKKMM